MDYKVPTHPYKLLLLLGLALVMKFLEALRITLI